MTSHCSGVCPFTDAAKTLSAIDERTQNIATFIEKVDKAVFTGNGKPGLLARVEALEQTGTAKGGMWTKILAVCAIVMSAISAFWKH